MMEYNEFINGKTKIIGDSGFAVRPDSISPVLFEWQRDIVQIALKKGRYSLFLDCGLGKTLQQLEWAKHVHQKTNKPVMIFAPLAVAAQTKLEGEKIGVYVNVCRENSDVKNGVNITNYDRMDKFQHDAFIGVVLDESSILKSLQGKTRMALTEAYRHTPYKLCCTATPAPNDFTELGSHSEFLGIMNTNEMLSRWFINDTFDVGTWRLKHHARESFWSWVSTWAVVAANPSDIGYNGDNYTLPELETVRHMVNIEMEYCKNGMLYDVSALSLSTVRKETKLTIGDRVQKAQEIVDGLNGAPCVVWCELNDENDALVAAIDGAECVTGSMKTEHKEEVLTAFSSGEIQVIVSKPKIAGFGLNWQHCSNMVFAGMSFSFESRYQAIRRCWRFGQKNKVTDNVILTPIERKMFEVVLEKEKKHIEMAQGIGMYINSLTDFKSQQVRMAEYKATNKFKKPLFI